MSKKPKPPVSAVAQLKSWLKRRIKFVLIVAAGFTTLAVAVTAGANAWPKVEPLTPISSAYFREEIAKRDKHIKLVEERTDKRFLDIQIDNARQAQRTTKAEVYRWQDKVNDEKNGENRRVYRDRMREYQETLDALNSQLDTLIKQKGQ